MTKKSTKKTAKPQSPVESNQIQINLNNVFPYMVSTLNDLNRKIDRLQMTVDAVGMAILEVKRG